jgi:uncharacterized membrane protein YbhN (UPF0104 family)
MGHFWASDLPAIICTGIVVNLFTDITWVILEHAKHVYRWRRHYRTDNAHYTETGYIRDITNQRDSGSITRL